MCYHLQQMSKSTKSTAKAYLLSQNIINFSEGVYSRQSSILSSCLSRHALFDFVMEGSTEVVVQTEVNTVSNLKVD